MIVQHHTKYREIHGVDRIVLMEMSRHVKLHKRLRESGKCRIPPKVLNEISVRAHGRTEKNKRYRSWNRYCFSSTSTLAPNVQLREALAYNTKTGSVTVNSYFSANNGKKLLEVWI